MRPGPGRELDALVAEKVMGLRLEDGFVHFETVLASGKRSLCCARPRPYSTDIEAAWEVFEKAGLLVLRRTRLGWQAQARDCGNPMIHAMPCGCVCEDGETAPHAICLAALWAVGVEVD